MKNEAAIREQLQGLLKQRKSEHLHIDGDDYAKVLERAQEIQRLTHQILALRWVLAS